VAKLIYTALCSLDGYIEDEEGNFDWAAPGEEVHRFVNELERGVGTHLYGRRMYETMAVWETDPSFAQSSAYLRDYAQIWQAADKVVYSTTLTEAPTRRTRIEREFDPDAVGRMKAGEADLAIGGPNLASRAFEAGLVDECRLFVAPVIVGGGKQSLPVQVRIDLDLLAERRFANGMVHLHYRAAG